MLATNNHKPDNKRAWHVVQANMLPTAAMPLAYHALLVISV
jgi:hypothetical protein